MPLITGLLSRAMNGSDMTGDRNDRLGADPTGVAARAGRALDGVSNRIRAAGERTAERARDRYATGADPNERIVEGLLDRCEPTPADERPEETLLRALHCVEDGLAGYDPEARDRPLHDALLEAAREEHEVAADRSRRDRGRSDVKRRVGSRSTERLSSGQRCFRCRPAGIGFWVFPPRENVESGPHSAHGRWLGTIRAIEPGLRRRRSRSHRRHTPNRRRDTAPADLNRIVAPARTERLGGTDSGHRAASIPSSAPGFSIESRSPRSSP